MVAHQQVRRFYALQIAGKAGFMLPDVRIAEQPGEWHQISGLRFDFFEKIITREIGDFCVSQLLVVVPHNIVGKSTHY